VHWILELLSYWASWGPIGWTSVDSVLLVDVDPVESGFKGFGKDHYYFISTNTSTNKIKYTTLKKEANFSNHNIEW
jgi:hypothetical protein